MQMKVHWPHSSGKKSQKTKKKKATTGKILWVLRCLEEDNISGQRDFESVLGLQQHVFNKSTTVSMHLPALTVLVSQHKQTQRPQI